MSTLSLVMLNCSENSPTPLAQITPTVSSSSEPLVQSSSSMMEPLSSAIVADPNWNGPAKRFPTVAHTTDTLTILTVRITHTDYKGSTVVSIIDSIYNSAQQLVTVVEWSVPKDSLNSGVPMIKARSRNHYTDAGHVVAIERSSLNLGMDSIYSANTYTYSETNELTEYSTYYFGDLYEWDQYTYTADSINKETFKPTAPDTPQFCSRNGLDAAGHILNLYSGGCDSLALIYKNLYDDVTGTLSSVQRYGGQEMVNTTEVYSYNATTLSDILISNGNEYVYQYDTSDRISSIVWYNTAGDTNEVWAYQYNP
ncbi:MAG: hypothetical protein OCD01_04965 [Fibrobacterales bacterium]